MNDAQNISAHNDEIDLYRLWTTLVRRKIMIFSVTFFSTLLAGMYVWNATPTYTGSALVEVGEVVSNAQIIGNKQIVQNTTAIFKLDDNLNNLKEITTQATGVTVSIPNGSSSIILLSAESSDSADIKPKLENAVRFIVNRHKEKALLYENDSSKIRMSALVGEIHVGTEPIKPKKQVTIVLGFIGGFMLAIFLAFALEFFRINRKSRD